MFHREAWSSVTCQFGTASDHRLNSTSHQKGKFPQIPEFSFDVYLKERSEIEFRASLHIMVSLPNLA